MVEMSLLSVGFRSACFEETLDWVELAKQVVDICLDDRHFLSSHYTTSKDIKKETNRLQSYQQVLPNHTSAKSDGKHWMVE